MRENTITEPRALELVRVLVQATHGERLVWNSEPTIKSTIGFSTEIAGYRLVVCKRVPAADFEDEEESICFLIVGRIGAAASLIHSVKPQREIEELFNLLDSGKLRTAQERAVDAIIEELAGI